MESATTQVAETVANHIEDVAEVTRQVNPSAVGWFTTGACFGFALGFYYGYRYNRKKIRAEILAEADREVEIIRDVYQQKAESYKAARDAREKPPVEEIVEEKGYSTAVVEEERPTKPPVPTAPARPVQFPRMRPENTPVAPAFTWDYPKELQNRSEDRPYVIHQDEYVSSDKNYRQEAYTYYAIDQVLATDEDVAIENMDEIIGRENLGRFGHGTDDDDVVFIRNDKYNLEIELCRINKSFEEEVHGLDSSGE